MAPDPRQGGQAAPSVSTAPREHDPADTAAPDAELAPTRPALLFPAPAGPLRAQDIGQLRHYRLIRDIGAGGMGLVYEAEDIVLHRRVALKVVRPGLPNADEARIRFLREARAAALVSHDNVVTIFQADEERGLTFMAMQLLDGESLEARLKRERTLPITDVVRIAREIALGLSAAHAKGLIHRDIKPANVWLEAPDGRVKILDFGLARVTEGGPALTHAGLIMGTPAYMSPEQSRGETLDVRTDLFSLGCIMYQMVTGERPFDGPNVVSILRNLELHQPPHVHVKKPQVPAALSALIMRLIAKDPRQRPASAKEVAEELKKLLPKRGFWSSRHWSALPPPKPASPPASPAGQPLRAPPVNEPDRRSSGLLRLLFILLFLGGGGFYGYRYVTDRGTLIIETKDVGATIEILHADGSLAHKSLAGERRIYDLRSGEYTLRITPREGWALSQVQVKFERGESKTVRYGPVPVPN